MKIDLSVADVDLICGILRETSVKLPREIIAQLTDEEKTQLKKNPSIRKELRCKED